MLIFFKEFVENCCLNPIVVLTSAKKAHSTVLHDSGY